MSLPLMRSMLAPAGLGSSIHPSPYRQILRQHRLPLLHSLHPIFDDFMNHLNPIRPATSCQVLGMPKRNDGLHGFTHHHLRPLHLVRSDIANHILYHHKLLIEFQPRTMAAPSQSTKARISRGEGTEGIKNLYVILERSRDVDSQMKSTHLALGMEQRGKSNPQIRPAIGEDAEIGQVGLEEEGGL